jgi:hypothetical protein
MLEVMSKCETPILLKIGAFVWTNFFSLTMWFSISPSTNRRWMFNKTFFIKIDTFCRIRSIILLDAQFYRSKIDHKIIIKDMIVLSSRSSFLFCWSFLKDLYGKFVWRLLLFLSIIQFSLIISIWTLLSTQHPWILAHLPHALLCYLQLSGWSNCLWVKRLCLLLLIIFIIYRLGKQPLESLELAHSNIHMVSIFKGTFI